MSPGPAVEPPYRWRDWAAREDGITGDELLAFVSQEEAVRPDGARGRRTRRGCSDLFFDRSGLTKEVWSYEHPLRQGRKSYTKTQPFQRQRDRVDGH